MNDLAEAESAGREWWAIDAPEALEHLDADAESGLSKREASARLERHGANALRHAQKVPWLQVAFRQFKSLVVVLLVAAGVVAAAFGDFLEAGAIGVVVLVNAAIGFWMELTAVRSSEALRELGHVEVTVVRDGTHVHIDATDVVPGDVVVIESGDVVSADMRILSGARIRADESVLTGESVPVPKGAASVAIDAPISQRSSMLFKGSSVTSGYARCLVVGTGLDTEIGRISALVESVEDRETPLEKRLDALAGRLVWVCLAIATIVGGASLLQGRSLMLVLETSIALAIATIPEGLPIVATIALARGMWRMAHRNALIKDLSAVETLGATSVICTDKTGTLTHNHLSVARVGVEPGDVEVATTSRDHGKLTGEATGEALARELLRLAALCNHAELSDGGIGDPLEIALLEGARDAGIEPIALKERSPIEREEPFDETTRKMATVHRLEDAEHYLVAVKGAPEAVLEVSSRVLTASDTTEPLDEEARARWLERNEALAGDGLRVLAVARKNVTSAEEEAYSELTFVGLVGLIDPPRDDVEDAIEACHDAGIRVVMLTGDQVMTARYIGHRVGIVDDPDAPVIEGGDIEARLESEETRRGVVETDLFARVTPAEKLHIIDLHQEAGNVVAMTGDGVNDAPALRRADIGVAMGQRGTEVAREAADMVLRDDAFSTIVAAVEQGRVIFRNIRMFVVYLMSCNIAELFIVSLAALAFPDHPLPITPLQILYLNLVTDVFPALALGVGEGDDEILGRPPRPHDEPVIRRREWFSIFGFGTVITVSVLAAFAYVLGSGAFSQREAITIAFASLAFGQVFHVFSMRAPTSSLWRNEVTSNRWVWGAVLLCTGLILGPVHLPGVSDVLTLTPIGPTGWAIVAAAALAPVVAGAGVLAIRARLQRTAPGAKADLAAS